MSKHPRCNARHAIEIHLSGSPELPRRHGAEIRAMGGHYSECRGDMNAERFVTLPLTRDGIQLTAELIAAYRGTHRHASKSDYQRGAACVIARSRAVDSLRYFTCPEALAHLPTWLASCESYDRTQEENRLTLQAETTAKLRARAEETAADLACLVHLGAGVQDRDEVAYLRMCARASAANEAAQAEFLAYTQTTKET